MNIDIRRSFTKDADKLPANIQRQLALVITNLQQVKQLNQIKNCKKIKGSKTAFRIGLSQYRIGLFFENETIELVRVLGRKDIYKYFP
jgi:mRNA-degrading endonuclease RelE of RelBE toxin-antitoxin system